MYLDINFVYSMSVYTQAGDVRDGKPGPNTRVKMFVHDVQTNTRVPLEPPPQYTDVYATCLATTPPVRGR